MGPDEKPIVVVKAPLAKIIRNPNHLTIYQDRVNRVNRLVTTAYLFSRYIFVHSVGQELDGAVKGRMYWRGSEPRYKTI